MINEGPNICSFPTDLNTKYTQGICVCVCVSAHFVVGLNANLSQGHWSSLGSETHP